MKKWLNGRFNNDFINPTNGELCIMAMAIYGLPLLCCLLSFFN